MVAEAPPQQSIAPTDQEFAARPVTPGCFVVTRPALSSHWARAAPKLSKVDYWMWQVSAVYLPGEMLPGTTTTLDEHIYVAHMFQPKKGCMVKAAWTPCWEVSGPRFLLAIAEKTKRREHKARLVFRMRHKKIGPMQSKEPKQSVTKSEQSKTAKQSAMK